MSALDRLEELERNASPGPWRRYADGTTVPGYDVMPGLVSDQWTDLISYNDLPRTEDLDLIAALRNAAPALLLVAREARLLHEAQMRYILGDDPPEDLSPYYDDLGSALDALDGDDRSMTPDDRGRS